MIFAVPAAPPVTRPVTEPTAATEVGELLHTPPETASLSVIVLPEHITLAPDISAGAGFMVMVAVEEQPLLKV